MSKPLPIWQELPTHFKENVVQYLDFLSRLNLRSCSKSDQSLVDSCPIHIETLEFHQKDDSHSSRKMTYYLSLYSVKHGPNYKFRSEEYCASALFNILSHWNSKCRYLGFSCWQEYSLDKFIEEFIGKLTNRDQKLNVDIFDWGSGKSAVLIQMFRFLKPGVLNKIRLNLMDFEDETKKALVRQLIETDHLNNGRELHLYNYSMNDYFQDFLRFDNLYVDVEKLTEEMLLKLMDAVKSRNPPIGSQFVITSEKVIVVNTLEPEFQNFENFEGVLNTLKQRQTPQKAVHLISDSRCLVIIKWNKAIEATVCGWKNWRDDFQKYHGDSINLDSI
ncbi:unnamed protein product [Caenorhabditis brenneri]